MLTSLKLFFWDYDDVPAKSIFNNFFSRLFSEIHFWTFINVQNRFSEKTFGRNIKVIMQNKMQIF
jgi:hypothetical protein